MIYFLLENKYTEKSSDLQNEMLKIKSVRAVTTFSFGCVKREGRANGALEKRIRMGIIRVHLFILSPDPP